MAQSIWKSTAKKTNYPSLDADIEVDVAIVGGGITGITSAYLLAESGKKVAVLESRRVSGGTSGDSTGNLYSMVDKRLHHIQSKWDRETARVVAQSRTAAVNLVERLTAEHNIDCDFRRVPWVLYSETNKKDETIEKERKAAEDYGLATEMLAELPIPVKVSSALRVDGQAQFNPAAFVRGLAEKVKKQNCQIFENTPVHDIQEGDKQVLSTPRGKVTAKKVILATHIPKGIYPVHTAVYPYREYAIAAKLRSGEFPEGIFWDTESKSHHSMRNYKTESGHYIVVVGHHHKVGQGGDKQNYFEDLERSARKHFDIESIDYKWSAQHYKPSDGLPFIGESHNENIFVATGFSTDGLTYGVMSAMIFNDLLNGRENPWAGTYEAGRFTPAKSAKEFIKENMNVAKQYADLLPGKADADEFSEVLPGDGKVVDRGGKKLAVYRDEAGKVECVSAICTHMACVVSWNKTEKSWDCPCHGSRFETDGSVIEGPALDPLPRKKAED